MKIKSMMYAALLALAGGAGYGYSDSATAGNPGCLGDCFAARYECVAQCGGGSVCRASCQAEHQACVAGCNE